MSAVVDKIVTGGDLTFHLEFERDAESGWYTVHVTELPGCVSQGATLDEAKMNIANALEAYMEVLLEHAIRSQTPAAKSSAGESARMMVRPHFEVRV
jgi:predicted RNase H-like HicB family nuclease